MCFEAGSLGAESMRKLATEAASEAMVESIRESGEVF